MSHAVHHSDKWLTLHGFFRQRPQLDGREQHYLSSSEGIMNNQGVARIKRKCSGPNDENLMDAYRPNLGNVANSRLRLVKVGKGRPLPW